MFVTVLACSQPDGHPQKCILVPFRSVFKVSVQHSHHFHMGPGKSSPDSKPRLYFNEARFLDVVCVLFSGRFDLFVFPKSVTSLLVGTVRRELVE